jgi:N-acetylglucosaminyldiphosphoundecaprenol N-acetyl-beta-D-mannosaminyltransferase
MVGYEETMDVMDAMVAARERGYVCAVAVHALMVAQDDPEMRTALLGSTLVLPDGMPIVWTATWLGERRLDRVYGPELMRRYCERCADRGHRVWLFGGRDEYWLNELKSMLRRRYPAIAIVGSAPRPVRPLEEEEQDALVDRINDARPDVLWLGIGAPSQEKWMARMRGRLEVPVMCGVGAAFDQHAGRVSEAPEWMQKRGLEWLYRITQEPRLLRRYAYYNPRFIAALARFLVRERRRGGH